MIELLLCMALAIDPITESTDSSIRQRVELEEVVIRDFKQNAAQGRPTSVSVANIQVLRNQEVQSLKELTAVFPNFYMPDYGSRQNTPVFIRGVGAKTKSPAVGFYVDGVPHFETSAFDIDMSDIAAVEVYRGPQGTLYGRNAIGGIINVYTHSPLDYQKTRLKLGYGTYNDIVAQASTYQKLTDNFGVSLAADFHHNNGYFKNVNTGDKADDINSGSGRIGLYWKPAERWLLHLNSMLDYSDQGGYPYAVYDVEADKLGDINYNRYSHYRRLVSTSGLNARYDGMGFSLNSQTSFQFIKDNQGVDQDFSDKDTYFVTNGIHQRMASQEFTIKSNRSTRYQWLFGVFGVMQNTRNNQCTNNFAAGNAQPTTYDIPVYAYALYHQSTYNIWRGLSATAGVRYDYEYTKTDYNREKVMLDGSGQSHVRDFKSKMNFHQVTPKVSLQYETTEKNLYYAGITRGYKAGGFNQSFQQDHERTYAPEYSWNYEVGTKLNLFDHRLTAELALFYIDWRHQQINYTVPGLGNVLTNAGHSNSKGLELTLGAKPVKNLQVDLNYGYTYAKFLTYHKSETQDLSGNLLPMVPRHTLSLNGAYTIYPSSVCDKIVISAGTTGIGKIYWGEDNKVAQKFYMLLNAKVSITKGIFTWEVWGKNITDKEYLSYGFASGTAYKGQQGRPATFGTSLAVTF